MSSPRINDPAESRAVTGIGDRAGAFSALGAYVIWGLMPGYFKLLHGVSPVEVIAHRIIWSLLFIALVLAVTGRFGAFLSALKRPAIVVALATSALLIGVNWYVYIRAVMDAHVMAASLGYFLNPLVNVLLGVCFLGERLRLRQWLAVALAAAGVALLASAALNTLWISLALAVSFALYGLVRKLAPVESLPGLGVETLLLLLPAIAILLSLDRQGALSFGVDGRTTALLMASGVISSTPLLLFASGARRLTMVTLGLMQFVAPTCQFLLALFVYDEPLSTAMLASFMLIWAGLILFMADTIHRSFQNRTDRG